MNQPSQLKVVNKFTYLGSTLYRAVHIDDGRLRANVGERNGIKLDTKLKVYKAAVLPILWYACETWAVYQRHAKRLYHFHLSCLRKLAVKNQMARQDSRLGGPEESRVAKYAYCLKASAAKVDWPCYKNA